MLVLSPIQCVIDLEVKDYGFPPYSFQRTLGSPSSILLLKSSPPPHNRMTPGVLAVAGEDVSFLYLKIPSSFLVDDVQSIFPC